MVLFYSFEWHGPPSLSGPGGNGIGTPRGQFTSVEFDGLRAVVLVWGRYCSNRLLTCECPRCDAAMTYCRATLIQPNMSHSYKNVQRLHWTSSVSQLNVIALWCISFIESDSWKSKLNVYPHTHILSLKVPFCYFVGNFYRIRACM